jgi:hypothetical protein
MHPQQISSPPYNNPNIQPLADQMNSMDINQGGSVLFIDIFALIIYLLLNRLNLQKSEHVMHMTKVLVVVMSKVAKQMVLLIHINLYQILAMVNNILMHKHRLSLKHHNLMLPSHLMLSKGQRLIQSKHLQ